MADAECHEIDNAYKMLSATKRAALIIDRLTKSLWKLGPPSEHPWSGSVRFWLDGRISGFRQPARRSWDWQEEALKIFAPSGQLIWSFTLLDADESRMRFTGVKLGGPAIDKQVFLTEQPPTVQQLTPISITKREAADQTDGSEKSSEMIKLVIWDLDDTFWQGTLAEGGIVPLQANINIVKTLTQRGIMNSICSKNHFDVTKAKLLELGVWDDFIFPRIEFVPKGAMIKNIIQAAQFRTSSVLFIDDNPMNINEARHYNPELQVCDQFALAGLLDDPRLKGKPDPERKRLDNYKILEKKAFDQASAGNDNLEFLRQSDIRVSFHHDVEAQFPRILDLVNRSNQLNFTKRRWPEDEVMALAQFRSELSENFYNHCGYVKVSDRYGSYGIVGFYLTLAGRCQHYLFSCRTLNMGIEQFVWQKIKRPKIEIVGEVVASLGTLPNWITVVDDADDVLEVVSNTKKMSICLRGTCDLAMVSQYLRVQFEISEEFQYPYKNWGILPVARAVALHDEVNTSAGAALIKRVPGMRPGRFRSAINTGGADVYVLSFSSEIFNTLHRSKSTNFILPFQSDYMGNNDFRNVPYETIEHKAQADGLTREEWVFLQDEFKLYGTLDLTLLRQDITDMFVKLQGKLVIVLMLNTEVGNSKSVLNKFRKINSVVRPLVKRFGYHTLQLNEFVRTTDDLSRPTDAGIHFNRDVYRKLAQRISEIVNNTANLESDRALILA